ncbi:conjugal transfer protein TrbL [Sphingobium indicum IP26]|uniref:Conjugal transfer protein TrbL n=1 Tax=Sphingobium indicum F2 TaxID=1450518 RepID=A0A8E0WRK2_9SPHN|nr:MULTISPECIES: P-type conjugative transfer protein TrbL [Sphingobium]EPR18796.1 conjugal transfer protein TrbL [Sphingobium indicum IP26]EQB01035.1 conjugal transfer protein TrbL [Sphingobium sp. HDIP04]KER36116.1 conjugal transfer protein TrbL [Sphingobium indicum F2]
MNDLNVIDRFLQAFITYIDSGFGLLGPDVGFLTATLIGIDITLAGLFWALGGEDNVIGRFLRKILYVGAFAFILNSFSTLADIIFRSFAQAGLTAGGGTLSADDLLKPGRLAGTGFSAAWPLLEQASEMVGFTTFFDNFLTIMVLLFAWALVIVAFFILAVQMFVCILEFKLTTLAGFILVPFALWNRTSFLAERVLGNVVSSGIKVMVLAVIVGIGSNFFTEFTEALQGQEPDIGQAMSLVLASLSLFGLGIFGPSIASGLVSGAPQLGAGAALGTTLGAAGVTMLAGGAAVGGARLAGGAALGAVRSGTSMESAASTAYGLGKETAAQPSVGAGLAGVARAAGSAAKARAGGALGLGEAASSGRQAAWNALNQNSPSPAPCGPGGGGETGGAPAWARAMRAEQTMRHRRQLAVHAISQGDRGGASATPDIKERND